MYKTFSVKDFDCFRNRKSSKRNSSCIEIGTADKRELIKSVILDWYGENDTSKDKGNETPPSVTPRKSKMTTTDTTKETITTNKVKRKHPLLKSTRDFILKTRAGIQLRHNTLENTLQTRNVYLMVESVDIKRVNYTAAFYLSQVFVDFPLGMTKLILDRETCFSKAFEFLKDRGWSDTDFSSHYLVSSSSSSNVNSINDMRMRERTNSRTPVVSIEDIYIPEYYFGRWSYDCTFAFEGKQSGSYMTCFNENDYYLVYKGIHGDLVSIPITSGSPFIPESMFKKQPLIEKIYRPPKRFICTKCPGQVPCIAPNHRPHISNIVKYPTPLLSQLQSTSQ